MVGSAASTVSSTAATSPFHPTTATICDGRRDAGFIGVGRAIVDDTSSETSESPASSHEAMCVRSW